MREENKKKTFIIAILLFFLIVVVSITIIIIIPPGPKTPTFIVENLDVSPREVDPGENVYILIDIANTTNIDGIGVVELRINGILEQTARVVLKGQEKKTVTFTIVKNDPGTYSIEVDGEVDTFKVWRPAEFMIENLEIDPEKVKPAEIVNISVDVANEGEREGTYTLNLWIDNVLETIKNELLPGRTSETATFEVAREEPKTYEVTVSWSTGSLTGSFTVEGPTSWWPILLGIAIVILIILVAIVVVHSKRRR